MGKHTSEVHHLQVRLSFALRDRLLAMAETEQRTLTVIVTNAIEKAVGDFESQKRQKAGKRARVA